MVEGEDIYQAVQRASPSYMNYVYTVFMLLSIHALISIHQPFSAVSDIHLAHTMIKMYQIYNLFIYFPANH